MMVVKKISLNQFLHELQHSSLTIVKGAGLVMRALIEEGEPGVAKRMQELALSEGALLTHLLLSLFTRDDDKRLLAHRQLSRHLVGLWVANNEIALSLLSRMLVRPSYVKLYEMANFSLT